MKTYNHLFEKVVDKDNIRKAILKAARGKRRKATVRKTLKHIDEAVEYLHKQIVNGVVVKRGIPIGFYTSPIFANIILDHIDHFVKEACGMEVYVRYMDDMILFSPNRRRLKAACLKVSDEVKRLGMVLKPVWQIHKLSSVLFLGYHFKRYCTKLRDRIFLKAVRLVRRIKAKGKITVHDCLRALSYLGRFKNADTYPAFVKYVSSCVNARELRKRVSNCFKKKGVYKNAFC